jgi:alpha-N-arabinofuranosidase
VLRVEPRGPSVATERYGEVPALDVTATLDPQTGATVLLAVNRDPAAALHLEADLRPLAAEHGRLEIDEHHVMGGDDPVGLRATNTSAQPDRVVPRHGTDAQIRDDCLTATLPAASWSALTLRPTTSKGTR